MPEQNTPYNHLSHTHCWNQDGDSPCGIPMEEHDQCCLCDLKVPQNTLTTRLINPCPSCGSSDNPHDCFKVVPADTLTTEQEVQEILNNFDEQIKIDIEQAYEDDCISLGVMHEEEIQETAFEISPRKMRNYLEAILTPLIEDRNARAREVVRELVDLFDESGNKVARNCVLFTARIHGIDLSEPKN